jgi:hypothetical protein
VVDQFPAPTKMVLSPAAQAVLDATLGEGCVSWRDRRRIAAAALRAAADQVVPEVDLHVSVANDLLPKDIGAAKWSARYEVRSQLLTLATELEAH